MISHFTITAGFQLNCSGLENKLTEDIAFFPIGTTITTEGGGGYCGWLNNEKEHEDAGNPSLYAFHFSD